MPGINKVMESNPGFIPNMVNGKKKSYSLWLNKKLLRKLKKRITRKGKKNKITTKRTSTKMVESRSREQYLNEQ